VDLLLDDWIFEEIAGKFSIEIGSLMLLDWFMFISLTLDFIEVNKSYRRFFSCKFDETRTVFNKFTMLFKKLSLIEFLSIIIPIMNDL
jgi:cellulose synthase/poly-beta-1,6-N-acetylglucosamine synthase-like glycosyltransferase